MKGRRGRKRVPPVKPDTIILEDYETVCRVCDAEFLDEEDLKMHVEQMHLSKCSGRMLCKVCKLLLPGAEPFVYHYIDKHLVSSSFCFYCYRIFFDPVLLDQHELKHRAVSDTDAVRCSQCSTIMPNRYKLQDHEYQEHRDSQDGVLLNSFFPLLSAELNMNMKKFIDCLCKKMPLVCCTCSHTTLSLNVYLAHLMSLKCECCVCDKCCNVYKRKSSIMSHMMKNPQCHNYVGTEVIELPCPKCDRYFNSSEVDTHVMSCNNMKCTSCEKQFQSINELAEHRVTEHVAKISLFTCRLCHKQFVGKLTLHKHMSRTHKNKSLYKYNCVHCGSLFIHPRRLFAHFFTKHKNILPYTCKICLKDFRLRKHFTFHIKLKHKSIGYVVFDKNMHVLFTDEKPKSPVSPKANLDLGSSTDASDIDSDGNPRVNFSVTRTPPFKTKNKLKDSNDKDNQSATPYKTNPDISKDFCDLTDPIDTDNVKVKRFGNPKKRKLRPRTVKQSETVIMDSSDELSVDSDEEPLSKIRESLMKEKYKNSTRKLNRDNTAKLTCNICKKYCYTVQYYHHHLTLHQKSKMKRCIKCNRYFKTKRDLKAHIDSSHTSSKLIETLKSVLEKRKKVQSVQPVKPGARPGECLKNVLEKRKKQQLLASQNSLTSKFQRTIQKVDNDDQCTATITPLSEHGLSVKNFIENFKPDGEGVSISNSVTLKAVGAAASKEPVIKMRPFNPSLPETFTKLRFPVKFNDTGTSDTKISVKLVQQLVTKPKAVNMVYNERVPAADEKSNEYCNMFADETDYTQYKNDSIPDVAQEVMLGDPEDIPRTRRLATEIYIPKIGDEHGGVRIGHLLPEAPYFKIVKVKKLLDSVQDPEPKPPVVADNDVKLPDGTRLISVKNPYAHLIGNDHLEQILKANRTKYYTPKTKNIGKAIAKALTPVRRSRKSRSKKMNT